MIARGRFHVPFVSLIKAILSLPSASMEDTSRVKPAIDHFEKKFGLENVSFLSSCRIAFLSVLEALELEKGSEVLLSPLTIPDMVNAIQIAGFVPVFVEMDLDTHATEFEDLKKKKNDKSKVFLLTYLSGLIPDVKNYQKYCKDEGLIFIEDFSQLIGGKKEGKILGSFGDFSVASFSIGKTVTSQVGGCLVINNKSYQKRVEKIISKYSIEIPKKSFFYNQLFENIKIEFLTSPFVFTFFTGVLLKFMAYIWPNKYLNIYEEGVINRFDEKDLFFDDVPVYRTKFNSEIFFFFNSFMADLLMNSLEEWDSRHFKRKENYKVFINGIRCLKNLKLAKSILSEDVFPIRVPIYSNNLDKLQLDLMKSGIDTGTYGLNLCNKEEVFSMYRTDLPAAEEIHKNCFFISLHEKVSKRELQGAIEKLKLLDNV